MAGPFAPSGRRVAARRRTPGVLGPRARPRPRCGLGLGAALRAGRKRPGPRPSPPHTPPARLGATDGKAGDRGLPSAPSGRVPPAPSACGPHPCPPWAAWAPPAPPACGGRGNVAAGRRLRRLRSAPLRGLPAASRCAGAPLRKARPSPCGARLRRGLALLLPRAGCGVGAPGRPAPTRGGFGAVRPSGPGGPGFGQPPRAGPPAALPALVRLCLR